MRNHNCVTDGGVNGDGVLQSGPGQHSGHQRLWRTWAYQVSSFEYCSDQDSDEGTPGLNPVQLTCVPGAMNRDMFVDVVLVVFIVCYVNMRHLCI